MVADVSVADVAVLEVAVVDDVALLVAVGLAGDVVDEVEAAGVTVELEALVVLPAAALSSLAAEHPDNPTIARVASPAHPTLTLKLRLMATERTGGGGRNRSTR